MTLLAKKLIATGLTPEQIRVKVGVSQPYISNVLNGKILKYNATKKFADAFGFDLMELLADFDRKEEMDRFFDGIAEPEIKYNPSSEDLVKKAKDLKNGKQKNSSEGRVVADDELVPVKTYIIPIKGFAGLRKHFFADEYIEKTFEETVTYVHRSERVPKLLKIQVDGNSMLPKIEPSDYCYCEPIPQIDWIGYRFKTDKIYCFFHHLRGILFKRAENKPHDQIELTSDNEDKVEYPNETFDIGEFKKILIVRTIEKKV